MKTDAIGRRKPTESQSIGEGYRVTPRLLRMARAIRRHDLLPTPLALDFWRGEEGGYPTHFKGLMSRVYHEPVPGYAEPLVTRPRELNPDVGPNIQPAWYELTATGYAIAEGEKGIVLPTKRDPYHHRAMGAAIGASMELLAPKHSMRYLDLESVLLHKRCPEETRADSRHALEIRLDDGRKLEPDGISGFEYLGGRGFKFFGREEDRSTESNSRSDSLQTAVFEKLDKWLTLFATKAYKKKWGLDRMHGVLFTTTRPGRVANALRYLEGKPYGDRIHFKVLPQFERHQWDAPRAPLAEVFEPWMTTAGPKDITVA